MHISLKTDEQGVGHVLAILAVVVLAALGGVGWYVYSKQSDSTSSQSVASKEAEKACKQEIDDKDFCKFASNWTELGQYTSVMTTSSTEGTSVMNISADGNGNTSSTVRLNDKETGAFIVIGNDTYTKDLTDGSWYKYTSEATTDSGDIAEDIKIDIDDSDVPEAERVTYKKIGKEACGKVTCFKYQIVDPGATDVKEQFIWFDDENYQLRRWMTTSADGSKTDATFEYETKVTVTAPSPIKEMPTADDMSAEEIQNLIDQYSN